MKFLETYNEFINYILFNSYIIHVKISKNIVLVYFISDPRATLLNWSYLGLNNRIIYGLKSYWLLRKN